MSGTGPTRRGLLAGTAGAAAAATAGCFSRLRSRISYDPAEQVSLSIKSVPADDDPGAVRIAQELRPNLEAAGVDVAVELLDEDQLLRDVLLNHDYDLFVLEIPGLATADDLRGLLHSRFGTEEGWQNPFGFASRHLDDLLAAQRRPGPDAERRERVGRVQRRLARDGPVLALLARDHELAASPSLPIPEAVGLGSPLSYLLLEPAASASELAVAIKRTAPTQNHNVLSVANRTFDRLTDLLYDPLARRIGGERSPWLASEYTVDGDAVTVSLRPDATWHDGDPLDAEDVAFTYRFLRDTSLGTVDSPVPAPRFRTRTSLVDGVEVLGDHRVRIDLVECRPELRPSVLEVPVLPESQWRDRSVPEHEYLTRALVTDVEEPVGSGPLRFVSSEDGQSLTLAPFEDHFLQSASDLPDPLSAFAGGPPYERLVAGTVPSTGAAVEQVAAGEADVADDPLTVEAIQDARDRPGVALVEAQTSSYYCVGCNARRHPLSNYAFRAALGGLLDREFLVAEVFDGLATPVETPLHATDWLPSDLEWSGEPVGTPFAGADGELDVAAARELFREAGFRYHDGELRG